MNDALDVFMILCGVAAASGVGYLLFGAVRIAVRRMERRAGLPQTADAHAAELEARVATLEEATGRLAELEERVDFAERMLARQRESERLDAGGR